MQPINLSLHPQETLTAGLLRVVDTLVDSGTDCMEHHSQNGESVHQVRTTIKRLRALLRLIRPAISQSLFDCENTRLRVAARRLSSVRDSEVARKTLETLPVSNSAEEKAVATVLSGLGTNSESPQSLDESMAEVRKDLEQTRRSLHRVTFRGKEQKLIEAGLVAVYRQGRKRMKTAIAQGQDRAFHRWRIRAKNLYYELQFLESIWPKRLHRMILRLAKLQEEIGVDHDISVLKEMLQKTPDAYGGSVAVQRVLHRLNNESCKRRGIAIPLGGKIWSQKPARFARKIGKHCRKR